VKKDKAADGAYIYAFDELPSEFKQGDSADNYTNTLTTPANGEITIKGIQQTDTTPTDEDLKREYEFIETKAPDGYNKLPESFKVTAQKTGESVTTETVKTKYLDENGNVVEEKSATTVTVTYETGDTVPVYEYKLVVNKQGTELPSTGGIGTTIFYVIGAILVLGAGILLVTRRRMNAN
jgi:LPXTG-motif cell wall-anchored protein